MEEQRRKEIRRNIERKTGRQRERDVEFHCCSR
jgi:hypothetical protein